MDPPRPPATPNPSAPVSSVLICAWVPPDEENLVPELWRLYASPEDRITCLSIGQTVFELNQDFQGVVKVDDRLVLLGWKPDNDESDDGGMDLGDDADPGALWNIYFEIPVN